ncbi:PfkB family carbohydrate kinase [Sphaerisporangium fuscum]|uniref:PfkB family carbohydrate kinase n=1 Tax=Sphaerisporangium fuscum TaxID=2835868 RepID=UPI001BDD214A|nr:PfkB family carbohydrate kinase [Sphaerisporangium fuscum]
MTPGALFVGLCTLDVVQAVERMPAADEKVTALTQEVAAGGPATNAAVTFAFLGGTATLLTAVGRHPLAAGIRADLADHGVRLADLTPEAAAPPAVSTIMVTRGSGDRAVVSVNAAHQRVQPPPDLAERVAASRVVHLDGHHPALALAAARTARELGRLTVLDGGSWKPGTAALLPYVDVAVASAAFHPPGTGTPEHALAHLQAAGVPFTAVTRGSGPVLWQVSPAVTGGASPVRARPVPATDVVDTLGAGDVLHGALTFALARILAEAPGRALTRESFTSALDYAIPIASTACRSFGTRAWMGRSRPAATHRMWNL